MKKYHIILPKRVFFSDMNLYDKIIHYNKDIVTWWLEALKIEIWQKSYQQQQV